MTTPIVLERPAKILLVSALGVYSRRVTASRTLMAVASVTAPPLRTRETVAVDTPACAATSPMVTRFTMVAPRPSTITPRGSSAGPVRG